MSKLSRILRGKKDKQPKKDKFPSAFTAEDRQTWEEVKAYTMTDKVRILSLMQSVRHVIKHDIQGSFVECGVWKGGSMMAVATVLLNMGCAERELYLFDTFDGMSAPTDKDIDNKSADAREQFEAAKFADREGSDWCYASLDEVRKNVDSIGYPAFRTHYIKGKVEDTLPSSDTGQIALLRLDTDFYESTKAEFEHLYPRLVSGGILILDDYYTWQGSKQAADEYLAAHKIPMFLVTVGGGGSVVGVKP